MPTINYTMLSNKERIILIFFSVFIDMNIWVAYSNGVKQKYIINNNNITVVELINFCMCGVPWTGSFLYGVWI